MGYMFASFGIYHSCFLDIVLHSCILTLIKQFLHIGFFVAHQTVENAHNLLHGTASWVTLMILKYMQQK